MRSDHKLRFAVLPAVLLCCLLFFAVRVNALAADVPVPREADVPFRPTGGVASPEIETILLEEPPLRRGGAKLLRSGEKEYCTTLEEAAAELRTGLKERRSTITFSLRTEAKKLDVDRLYDLAFAHTGVPDEGDYLERGFGSSLAGTITTTTYYIADDVDYCLHTLTYTPSYYTTAEEEAQVAAMTEALLSELITEGMTDSEKVEAIYNWIAKNVEYDDETDDPQRYTAYAALTKHKAVCQGYATLFYRMALSLGIDCRYISGTALPSGESHGWNIVKLGDLYYDLDVTWNSERLPGTSLPLYYLRGSGVFDLDHIRKDQFLTDEFQKQYPTSRTDYFEPTLEKDPTVRITDFYVERPDGSAVTLADYQGESLLLIYGLSYDLLDFLNSRTDELSQYNIHVLVSLNTSFDYIDLLSSYYPDFVFGVESDHDFAWVNLLKAMQELEGSTSYYPMAFMINGNRECVYHSARGVAVYDTLIPQLAALAETEETQPAQYFDVLHPCVEFSYPTLSGGTLTPSDCVGKKTLFVYGFAGNSFFFTRVAYYADWLEENEIDVVAVLCDVADNPELWASFSETYKRFICVQSDEYNASMWAAVELFEPGLDSLTLPVMFMMNANGDYVHFFSYGIPGCLFDLLDWFVNASNTYSSGQVIYAYDALARQLRLVESLPDNTTVFAAYYDADGRMLGLAALTDASPALTVPAAGQTVKLFFIASDTSAPIAQAAVLAA